MITRRHFIVSSMVSSAASLLLPHLALADEAMLLRAQTVKRRLRPDFGNTLLWGFNGSTPGPTLRVKQGERINVKFENALRQPSAIHWHGIHIDNKMDGVPDLTQKTVSSGDEFLYNFIAPDAGTYWYHSHNRSLEQVARGLYGALIVEEKNPPLLDHDIVVFIDDWRLNSDGSLDDDFNSMRDKSHSGRIGNFANAIFRGLNSQVKLNQRIRLRLINVATDKIFPLQISGLNGKVVAYDGMPLENPESIDAMILAPAQRIDIIADVTGNEISINSDDRSGYSQLGRIAVKGSVSSKKDYEIILPKADNYKAPSLNNAVQLTLDMGGGAMSVQAMKGMMSGNYWTFNGTSGLNATPFYEFKAGQTAIIKMVNDTFFSHAIHLHGHHFQEITDKGLGPSRDTILVGARKTTNIACVFDNPGNWLFHCHMLAHQAAGMKTWVTVV